MPASQTSYARTHDFGRPGQVADLSTFDGDSRIVGADELAFGVACRVYNDGTNDVPGEVGPGMATDKFEGISVLDPTRDPVEDDMYDKAAHATVAVRGDIYVQVELAVEYGDDVVARSDTGALSSARVTAAWAQSIDYKVGDVVTHSGSSYRCIRDHTSATGNVVDGAPNQGNQTGWGSALTTAYSHIAVPGGRFRKAAAADGISIVRVRP